MKKIVIIDGQGGKMGSQLAEKLIQSGIECEIYAIGTNSIATSAMLKAGAHFGATGENPARLLCADADIITGPLGIVVADSLLGEVTPGIAMAVGQSRAKKVLIPVSRCDCYVVTAQDAPLSHMIGKGIELIKSLIQE